MGPYCLHLAVDDRRDPSRRSPCREADMDAQNGAVIEVDGLQNFYARASKMGVHKKCARASKMRIAGFAVSLF